VRSFVGLVAAAAAAVRFQGTDHQLTQKELAAAAQVTRARREVLEQGRGPLEMALRLVVPPDQAETVAPLEPQGQPAEAATDQAVQSAMAAAALAGRLERPSITSQA